jgi:aminoglycoside phosphotransferase (APT) family kinase protein
LLGSFLTRLHRYPPREALRCGGDTFDAWRDHLRPLVMAARDLVPPASRTWLERVAARLDAMNGGAPPRVLVHGDLHASHVLLDGDGDAPRLCAVLDFIAGPLVTDPALDFSLLVQHYGLGFAKQVFQAYEGERDTHFLERARLYNAVRPAFTLEIARQRDVPAAAVAARRQIAARAAAASRVR